jgi:hypothetical protein
MLARMVATGGPPPEPVTIVLPQLQFLPHIPAWLLHQRVLQFLLQFLPQLRNVIFLFLSFF